MWEGRGEREGELRHVQSTSLAGVNGIIRMSGSFAANELTAEGILVVRPHSNAHALCGILEQARELGPDLTKMNNARQSNMSDAHRPQLVNCKQRIVRGGVGGQCGLIQCAEHGMQA